MAIADRGRAGDDQRDAGDLERSALVPLPLIATASPVSARVADQAPSKRSITSLPLSADRSSMLAASVALPVLPAWASTRGGASVNRFAPATPL